MDEPLWKIWGIHTGAVSATMLHKLLYAFMYV